jgi:hypothetical protein
VARAEIMGNRGGRDNEGQRRSRVGERGWRAKAEERQKAVKSHGGESAGSGGWRSSRELPSLKDNGSQSCDTCCHGIKGPRTQACSRAVTPAERPTAGGKLCC